MQVRQTAPQLIIRPLKANIQQGNLSGDSENIFETKLILNEN